MPWIDGRLPDEASLGQAQDWVQYHRDEGAICPCCAAKCRRYRRRLHAAMAWTLLLIYRKFRDDPPEGGWLHVESFLKGTRSPSSLRGDFAKLRYWGLLESREGQRGDGNPCNGLYRITARGRAFARRRLAVPSHSLVYRREFEGLDGHNIDVVEALGRAFNYRELFGGWGGE